MGRREEDARSGWKGDGVMGHGREGDERINTRTDV